MKEEINTAVRQHVLELIRSFLTKEEWKYVEEKFCRSIQRYSYNRLTRLVWEYAPKGVFVIWPSPDRYPYMAGGKIVNIGPWSEGKYLDWMFDNNSRNHNNYHARAYKLLWKLTGVPVYDVTHHYTNCETKICETYVGDFKDFGIDGQHWGPVMAEHVASLLYQKHQLNL
jgi:hypothetical protein